MRHTASLAVVLAALLLAAAAPALADEPALALTVTIDLKGLEGPGPGWGYEGHVEADFALAESWKKVPALGAAYQRLPGDGPAEYLRAKGGVLGLEAGAWLPLELLRATGGGRAWGDGEKRSYGAEQRGAVYLVRTATGAELRVGPPQVDADDGQGLWAPCQKVTEESGREYTFPLSPDDLRNWRRLQRTVERTIVDEEAGCSARFKLVVGVTIARAAADDVELVPPKGLERWVPAGDLGDAEVAGNTVSVTARVKKRPDAKAAPQPARFQFELRGTSRAKGVCMNWPHAGGRDAPDLAFEPRRNAGLEVSEDRQTATSRTAALEQQVVVSSFDFGGFTRLKVTALFADGTRAIAHLEGDAQRFELQLPADLNSNHIADAVEHDPAWSAPGAAEDSDEDADPIGDGCRGDGLSRYEEYRGFVLGGRHTRTRPGRKDVFIFDEDGLRPDRGPFLQSKLEVHLVNRDELAIEAGAPNIRVINPYREQGTLGPQYVLYLHTPKGEASADTEQMAVTNSPADPPYVPRDVQDVVVNTGRITAADLPNTVAHELAHACHVLHHGEQSITVDAIDQGGKWVEQRDEKGRPVVGVVALPCSAFSGAEDCVMRYNVANYYWRPGDPRAVLLRKAGDGAGEAIRAVPYGKAEPPGATFCTSPAGTGVNRRDRPGGPKAGDAAPGRGNCARQFCVNPARHPPVPKGSRKEPPCPE